MKECKGRWLYPPVLALLKPQLHVSLHNMSHIWFFFFFFLFPPDVQEEQEDNDLWFREGGGIWNEDEEECNPRTWQTIFSCLVPQAERNIFVSNWKNKVVLVNMWQPGRDGSMECHKDDRGASTGDMFISPVTERSHPGKKRRLSVHMETNGIGMAYKVQLIRAVGPEARLHEAGTIRREKGRGRHSAPSSL